MAHRIDRHYTDLGGLDTRANKLMQNPKAAREGSKNFRWNFEDELVKLNGFQHKTQSGIFQNQALLEYKYQDIDTGEALSQILSVGSDGNLYQLIKTYLKLTVTAASAIFYYSMIYDEIDDAFKFIVYGTTQNVLATIPLLLTTTLDDLSAAINALAITGLTSTVVDDTLFPVSSSEPAYLLDIVYLKQFNKAGTDNEFNSLYSSVLISTPNGTAPFPSLVTYKDDPTYQGISSVNLNNVLYITDGGFLMKYDGFQVYRAGMPTTIGRPNQEDFSGSTTIGLDDFSLAESTGGALTSGAKYKYRFQFGFVDPNGAQILGKIFWGLTVDLASLPGNAVNVAMRPIWRDTEFPVYSAQVSTNGILDHTNKTIHVFSGHNIKAGMTVRLPITNTVLGQPGYSFMMCSVKAVTTTTVVLTDVPVADTTYPWDGATDTVVTNTWIQAGYALESWDQKVTDIVTGVEFNPPVYFGAFIRIWRTKGNDTQYYHHSDFAAFQHGNSSGGAGDLYTFQDTVADSFLNEPLDLSEGEDLPRAGKYIGAWQGFLIQGGAPYNQELANAFYPTIFNPPISGSWGVGVKSNMTLYQYYTQVHLCDFQSIFWNDALNSEGFPQSGANQEDFENGFNDQITGFIGNKDALFIFKNRTTAILNGTIGDGNLVKEILEADVGAVNIQCLALVRGSIVFLDEKTGFWSVVAGQLPQFIGYAIEDTFRNNDIQSNANFLNYNRAVATNFKLDSQYLCFIPAGKKESNDSGPLPDPTSSSVVFVFDYGNVPTMNRAYWAPLKEINAFGGLMATADDDLLFCDHIGTNGRLWKQRRTGTKYDFCNHTSAVEFLYKSSFLGQGMPAIDKHHIQVIINSIQGGFSLIIQQYYNFLDYLKSESVVSFAVESDAKVGVKKEVKCNNNKTQSLSIGFYNNDKNAYVRVQGWELEFSAEFDVNEVKK